MLHSLRYILFPVLNITAPVLIAFSFIMLLVINALQAWQRRHAGMPA